MLKQILSQNVPKATGPYSQGIMAGNFIFCSGQIALSPETGELVSEKIEEQTKQVLKNLQAVLQAAKADFKDVVRTDIFVKNISNFKVVNEVYADYFTAEPKPARQTVEVSNLPKGALVEISCVALKP